MSATLLLMERPILNSNKEREDLIFFEKLYNDLFMKGVYYANQYIGSFEISKEIVQDSFITLWNRRDKIYKDKNPEYYLLTCIRNRAFNYLRDTKRRGASSIDDVDLLLNMAALREESFDAASYKEISTIIRSTLNEMPSKMRDVFLMSRDKDLSYSEIANELSISVKAVEYRMSKALALFRRSLKEYLPSIIIVIFLGKKFF